MFAIYKKMCYNNFINTHTMKKKTSKTLSTYVHPGSVSLALLTAFLVISVLVPAPAKQGSALAAAPTPSLLERLMGRMHGAATSVSSEEALKLLEQRAALMKHSTTVFLMQDGIEVARAEVKMQDHPTWIKIDSSDRPTLVFNRNEVRNGVLEIVGTRIAAPTNCSIGSVVKDAYGITRTDTKCIAKEGLTFDESKAIESLAFALLQNTPEVIVELIPTGGDIDASLIGMSFPDVLGVGTSNFKGSPWGRAKNVHKAIEEKINGVVVPAGETLSFNKLLGPRVTQGNGWAMALGIFEGGELRMTPGGGICQTSTTVYRAVLNAGLPVAVQRNHSLFVHYYEVGGVGLDATVFYDHQDLKFVNDTGHPILIQAEVVGDDVTVAFHGTSDGRTATLNGPFVVGHDGGQLVNGRAIRPNEIVWTRTVTKLDGTTNTEQLVSRYKAVPNYVRKDILKAAETVTTTQNPL